MSHFVFRKGVSVDYETKQTLKKQGENLDRLSDVMHLVIVVVVVMTATLMVSVVGLIVDVFWHNTASATEYPQHQICNYR